MSAVKCCIVKIKNSFLDVSALECIVSEFYLICILNENGGK